MKKDAQNLMDLILDEARSASTDILAFNFFTNYATLTVTNETEYHVWFCSKNEYIFRIITLESLLLEISSGYIKTIRLDPANPDFIDKLRSILRKIVQNIKIENGL